MSKSPGSLLKEIGKQQMNVGYQNKGRNIAPELWHKLKQKRECDKCHEHFNQPLYIHHMIPIRCGGTNTEENLVTVCWNCHQILDEEQLKKYPKEQKPNDLIMHHHKTKMTTNEISVLHNTLDEIFSATEILKQKILTQTENIYRGDIIQIKNDFNKVKKSIIQLKQKMDKR